MKKDEAGSMIRPLKNVSMRAVRKGELLSRQRLSRFLICASHGGQLRGESGGERHIDPDRFGCSPNALEGFILAWSL